MNNKYEPGETLGSRIRQKRLQIGYTQQELADILCIAKPTINRYEYDVIKNPPHKTLVRMAEVLNTTPEYLLGWDVAHGTEDPAQHDDILSADDMDIKLISINRNRLTSEQKRELVRLIKYMYPQLFTDKIQRRTAQEIANAQDKIAQHLANNSEDNDANVDNIDDIEEDT